MKNLIKIFPFVEAIFASEGLSSSKASLIKATNGTNAAVLLEKISYDNEKVYDKQRLIISKEGVHTESISKHTLNVKAFECIPEVQALYAQSAILGSGIKLKERMQNAIDLLGYEEIARIFEIEVPKPKVLPVWQHKVALNGYTLSQYLTKNRIEELYELAGTHLMLEIGKFYHAAMKAEAHASVLANQLGTKSTLASIRNAPQNVLVKETGLKEILIQETNTLAVSKEEFRAVEKDLSEQYAAAQENVNKYLKQIKDIARKVQSNLTEIYETDLRNQKEADKEYANEYNIFCNEIQKIKNGLLKEIAALKIIPE